MSDVVDAVIFDLDGVIVDSEPVWERVRRAYVGEHGGAWQAGHAAPADGDEHRTSGPATSAANSVSTDRPRTVATEVVARMARATPSRCR